MRKARTIRRRITLTVISLAAGSLCVLGTLAYVDQTRQIKEGFHDLAVNEGRLFQSVLTSDAEGLSRAHTGLTRLDTLLRPFAAGDKDALLAAAQPIFADIKAKNNITHMYFIRTDGTVLLRVHKPQDSGDKLTRATFENAASSGSTASGIEMGKNFFSLRCVQPVVYQGTKLGYMEVAEEIDHVFQQMKKITGNDESLFLSADYLQTKTTDLKSEKVGSFSILYPTDRERTLQLAAKLEPAMKQAMKEPLVTQVSLGSGKYLVGLSPVQDASGSTVGVLFTQKDVTPLYGGIWRRVLMELFILGLGIAAVVGTLYLSLRKSLALFRNLRQHIVTVTTTWDLSKRLPVETEDEIGELALDFNLMTEKLADMVSKVSSSSRELNGAFSNIKEVSGKVADAAGRQAGAVNETSAAITQIKSSIEGVAQGVEGLSSSAAESTSSILELAASVEEVAINAEALARSVEEVSSSVGEMTASIKQVKESAGVLMDTASVTSSSIMEMDSSIKQVERNARDTAVISETVRQDAEVGKEAVDAAIAGMEAIKSSSRITSDVIKTLSDRAGDIGAILSVIDDVAGQTNLLALNAAIIAAQAGEHGKGFAVVADEIKQLAERTSRSTREIAEVIKAVQEETRRAVQAIGVAEKSITEGEGLSRKSGEALAKIVTGVKMATDQVESIARATMEQSKGSQMIRDAMDQVADMVKQIASATSEQGRGSALIMKEVDKMNSLTVQLKNSTREQSNTGHFIAKSTEHITEMIDAIKGACEEQSRSSDQILPAVENIMKANDSNLDGVMVLGTTLQNLSQQINILQEEIGRFNGQQ